MQLTTYHYLVHILLPLTDQLSEFLLKYMIVQVCDHMKKAEFCSRVFRGFASSTCFINDGA